MAEHEGRRLRPRGRQRLEEENGRSHGDGRAAAKRADDSRCEAEHSHGQRVSREREGNLQRQAEREAEPGGRRGKPFGERKDLFLHGETDGRHEREDPERHARGPSADTREGKPREADDSTDRGTKRPMAHVDMAVRHLGPMMRGDRDCLDGDVRYYSTDGREGDQQEPGEAVSSHAR